MREEFIFQRRNRLKKHFVNISNVLLYGYQHVSDAAKITYQVIDGFDWESKETGDSKGFVYPSTETLAKIRNTTDRTIRRHIEELIKANLLTRVRRRNKSSILVIEDISEEEINLYLKEYVDKPKSEEDPNNNSSGGGSQKILNNDSTTDKNVHSETLQRTKMSDSFIKEKENLKLNEINVNENFTSKGNGQIQSLRDILIHYDLQIPRKTKTKRRNENWSAGTQDKEKRDYLALEVANNLNDHKSLGAFRVIAEKVPEFVIFEVLSSIKEAAKEGKIRKSRGALFIDIIKGYCGSHGIDLGFGSKNPSKANIEALTGILESG